MSGRQNSEAVASKIFRIDEFRNPKLPDEKRRALEAADGEPLDMSVAGVLAAARAQTGLDDFGPADFEERLGRLLGEVRGRRQRLAHGQGAVRRLLRQGGGEPPEEPRFSASAIRRLKTS